MQKEHWQKIEEIFHAATGYHGREREEYLLHACKDDQATLSELVALLKEHENPSPSLERNLIDIGLQIIDKREGNRTGETIGHFQFGKLIGHGGMGEVYAAEDTRFGGTVAIKLVNELFALDPERIRRFRKEANAASRVSHPNVAKLYELCDFDGEHLIVMELVEGESLRHLMSESLPAIKALDFAIQVASALGAAHAAGVVHRDIKPENIIIKPDGTVKVLDFGLAKLVDPIGPGAIHIPGGDETKLTVDMSTELGALMGTPAYMSPEQIRGAGVDTQTDIWSLGVLLYEMLSGELPFGGLTKIDLIAAVLVSEPAPLKKEIGEPADRINTVIRKALSKEKSNRYREAGELFADLQSLKNDADRTAEANGSRLLILTHSAWKYAAGIVVLMMLLIAVLPASRRLAASYLFPTPQTNTPISLPVTDGLLSYWPADGNANDVVGANNGELLNGATCRPGVVGQAFSFDGVDDLMQAPTNGLPTGNHDRTIAMWVKVDDYLLYIDDLTPNPNSFFGGYGFFGSFGESYFLGMKGKFLFITNWGEGPGIAPLETGKWYHIAATTDAKSTSLYVDGVLVYTGSFAIDTPANTQFYSGRIAGQLGEARRLKGAVDEIAIYDRALSFDEIQTLVLAHTPPNI